MAYSADSPITGTGVVSAARIEAWMAHKGRQLAPRFAPDGEYKAPPAGIGQAIIVWSIQFGINSDIVAADIMHESAGWQSRIVRDKNNPSGLGATNDAPYENAVTFDTPNAGCRATAAHMAVYARGDGPWAAYDPRYEAVKARGWLGVATSLRGLDGRWAFPGVGYGGRIAAAANDLLEFEEPMAAQIPGFQWFPADSRHHTRGRTARIRGAAQHYSAGKNSRDWLSISPNSNVSATCLVKHNPTMADRGWQLVRIEDTPHTTAFANPYTASVEYEHDGTEPIPDIAYDVLGATWADIERYVLEHNLGDFSEGIKGHREWVNNPSLICPDGINMARVVERWQFYRGTPPPPDDDDWPTVPVTERDPWRADNPYGKNRWIPRVIVAAIRVEGFMASGFVVSEAFPEDDKLVQYFERKRWELNRDGSITAGLVGLEAMVCRYPERKIA